MPEERFPSWVPEVAPGVHADVYPVSPPITAANPHPPPPAELRLDRSAVTHGYFERALPFEFASRLPPAPDRPLSSAQDNSLTTVHLAKLRDGLTTLRRARPSALQRHALPSFPQPPADGAPDPPKRGFPLQKPMASPSLEDWFNRLASGSPYTTYALARAVPLGPAIVRATGKVIEMMATRNVPAQRAAWYIRIAVLNECMKHIRPDRPPPSPRALWTRTISSLLRSEIEAIRARKTAVLGSMDRLKFWEYVFDLVRWQLDEGLLDLNQWIKVIADVLRNELTNSQTLMSPSTTVAVAATRRFLPEFVAEPDNARLLCEVIMPTATTVVRALRSSLSNRDPKSGKLTPGKAGKRTFQVNACHHEITIMLGACLRALEPSTEEKPSLRLSDLERFVKKGAEIISSAKEAKKAGKDPAKSADVIAKKQENPAPLHFAIREFEKLPSHGDVARVVKAVHVAAKEHGGASQAAVKIVCQWVVEGPAGDRAEGICIATAVLMHIAEGVKSPWINSSSSKQAKRASMLKRGKKTMMQAQPAGTPVTPQTASQLGLKPSTDSEPPLQFEIWSYFKEYSEGQEPENLDKDNVIVRLLAQLCRLDVLSLQGFVRDVSRLSSCGHAGSSFLVKCLSMLPDPLDKSVSDCRRSLLRKFGYLSNAKQNYSHGIEDEVVQAACGGNMELMETEAEKLVNNGSTNVILSTAEAVRLKDVSTLSEDTEPFSNRLYSITSFLLFVDEPGMVVEWLVDNLGAVVAGTGAWKSDNKLTRRKHCMTILTRLAFDVSRYVASCGQLSTVYGILKKGFQADWISPSISEQVLYTVAAMSCTFGKGSGSGSGFWTSLCARTLEADSKAAQSQAVIAFAVASLRGRVDVRPDEKSTAGILDLSNRENWGLTPDEDLQSMAQRANCRGVVFAEQREALTAAEYDFPLDPLYAKGLSANDIFGGIFIPVLAEPLTEARPGAPPPASFPATLTKILQILDSQQSDVRLQGLNTTLIIEFVAVIVAGCFCLHIEPQPSQALEALVRLRWMWKILTARAGIKLSRRLRARVDHYCEKTTTNMEKRELSATLYNMVMRAWGETEKDEMFVTTAIMTEPFGTVEMQLALLAVHRRDCNEEEMFGPNIASATGHLVDRESSYSVTSIALQCCAFEEEYRETVAGTIAFESVSTMSESLNYVVTGLTVESTKNTKIHQERADQWYEADMARRVVLEHSVEFLSGEVGVQVEAVLYEQLDKVTEKLTEAQTSGCLPSSLLTAGGQISDAMESRLMCILKSKRTTQDAEAWKGRTKQIARLLKSGAPLMKRSTVQTCLSVLHMCIRNLGECSRASDDKSGSSASIMQILDRHTNRDFKRELQNTLAPTLYWTDSPERDAIIPLVGKGTRGIELKANRIRAFNAKGTDLDNWLLLEGYGRAPEEECSILPTIFWRQGDGGRHTTPTQSVRLKRTFSTYASLVA